MNPLVIIDLLNNLTKLGASEAVQQLILGWIAKHAGMSAGDLDKVIQGLKTPPPPCETTS